MAKKQDETRFKEKILPLLRALPNSWGFKTQQVTLRGIPDILFCINGRFVALELKRNRQEAARKTGHARLQGHILIQIRNAGGYAEFCFPENWEEIHRELSLIAVKGSK